MDYILEYKDKYMNIDGEITEQDEYSLSFKDIVAREKRWWRGEEKSYIKTIKDNIKVPEITKAIAKIYNWFTTPKEIP